MSPRGPGRLDILTTSRDGRVVLHAVGELDTASSNRLIAAVCAAMEESSSVELDISGLAFIDATGLGALKACAQSAADHHWDFFVSGESPAVDRVAAALPAADQLLRRWRRPG